MPGLRWKEKITIAEVFATSHRRRWRKNSRSESTKRRGHSAGNTFLSFDLNQPVPIPGTYERVLEELQIIISHVPGEHFLGSFANTFELN